VRGRRVCAAAVAIALGTGCTPSRGLPATTAVEGSVTAETVAVTVLDALAGANPGLAATHTLTEQMAWLAMAEGASLEQAAALLDSGADQVAVNYWTGFIESGALPAVVVDAVEEQGVGSHQFTVVRAGDLRLVLRGGSTWRVDVVASFGATLAQRLAEAAAVVAANRGEDAERLRLVLLDQQDSVAVAAADPSLTEPARQGLATLAEVLAEMGS
jgi:hypothetical protein